jgi:hypothetical protein
MAELVEQGVKPVDDAIEKMIPELRALGEVAEDTSGKVSNSLE